MKHKTALLLIEQAVMLLILAVAAALCLRVFAWSDDRAAENYSADQAMLQLQSAAEVLKQYHGDFSAAAQSHGGTVHGGQWQIIFDSTWAQSDTVQGYRLRALRQDSGTYLGSALLEITDPSGTVLGSLTVSWQEVSP